MSGVTHDNQADGLTRRRPRWQFSIGSLLLLSALLAAAALVFQTSLRPIVCSIPWPIYVMAGLAVCLAVVEHLATPPFDARETRRRYLTTLGNRRRFDD